MEEQKEKKEDKKSYRHHLGPLMEKVLNKQRERVIEACYGHANPSYKEIGEILAQKILDKGLV